MDLIKRRCAVCHSADHFDVFDQPTETIIGIGDIGYHHKIQMCSDCGFVFASPVLPEGMILGFYEKMSNYEHPESGGLRPQAEKNQIHRYVELINGRLPADLKGRALDIGCSTAYALSLFKARGWDVTGLDPSDKCIELSQQHYGVRVIKGFFNVELLRKEQPFDLIMLCHVVEHLLHPDTVIRELGSLLAAGGMVYIEVPNLMEPRAPKCYFGFEHVNFFTPTSLTNIAHANGFEVDHLSTFDNGPVFSPFYPVIALTMKKASTKVPIKNDRAQALPVIEEFKRESQQLVSSLQATVQAILDSTPEGRIALWGAGIHTSQLLSETALGRAKIACVFDNDPKKHGSRLMGHPVVRLSGDPGDVKKTIDAIIISSEASENIIYEQISYLEKYGIKVCRLYHHDQPA